MWSVFKFNFVDEYKISRQEQFTDKKRSIPFQEKFSSDCRNSKEHSFLFTVGVNLLLDDMKVDSTVGTLEQKEILLGCRHTHTPHTHVRVHP